MSSSSSAPAPSKERKDAFKHGFGSRETMVSRRRDQADKIRKNHRNQQHSKRRKQESSEQQQQQQLDIAAIVRQLAPTCAQRSTALHRVRLALLSPDETIVNELVNANIIPLLIQCLHNNNNNNNNNTDRYEAAWCLTNLAAEGYNIGLQILPAVPILILCLQQQQQLQQQPCEQQTPEVMVIEQCVWCLGNLATDEQRFRDCILQAGALPLLLQLLATSTEVTLLRTVAWTVSNLIQGGRVPLQPFIDAGIVVAVMRVLQQVEDVDAWCDCVWIVAYLTGREDDDTCITQVMSHASLVPAVLSLLDRVQPAPVQLLIPVWRVIGNVSAVHAHIEWSMALLQYPSLLTHLTTCMQHDNMGLRRDATWVLSNLLTCGSEVVTQVVAAGNNNMIDLLVQRLVNDMFDVRKEALYALYTICHTDVTVAARLLQQYPHALAAVLDMLRVHDAQAIRGALEFIALVLARVPNGVQMVEEADGIDALESLQLHNSAQFWSMARQLVDKYYGEDEIPNMTEQKTDTNIIWRLQQ